MKMKSDKMIRIGTSIYKAGEEVNVKKEDVPTFQKLGFRRTRSKPAPAPIIEPEETALEIENEEI